MGAEVTVARNDQISLDDVAALQPERIVVSPGPKRPEDAGISVELIRRFAGQVPILGVCLGHQCIGAAFGGKIVGAGEIMHGKSSVIEHDGMGVYAGLPNPIEAIRYHSLAIDPDSMPEEFFVTSRTDSGVIMGVRHREFDVEGVQFHPESIMTVDGHDLLRNFLSVEEGVPA